MLSEFLRANATYIHTHSHAEGGGWCNSDANCLSRSKTALGSSKGYASAITQESGYWSDDPAINPMMWNFTKVYLPYC